MAMSMTGYGRSILHSENTTITVEIRSVNHRFLDFTAKIPRSFLFLEDTIKKVIQSYFKRGKIEVFISIEGEGFIQKNLITDWNLMDQYMNQVNEAKERYNLTGDIPTTIINSIPDIIAVQETDNRHSELKDSIIISTEQACEQVLAMRMEEGIFLLEDLKERINTIKSIVIQIQTRRPKVVEEYKERILSRINTDLGDIVDIDQARIHQEVVLLAEKGDITEEVTRLFSHIAHFKETLSKKYEPIGRKLDFITQEMHREANTIGSKSTDTEISESTISLKSEIEKIKEQLQNIE